MADLAPRAALEHCAIPMRLGPSEVAPGVLLRTVADTDMHLVIARKGKVATLREAAAAAGFALPATPNFLARDGVTALWAGPEQWLIVAEPDAPAAQRLIARLAEGALVIDQSDARAIVEVSGPAARACLAKGIGIDLHPRSFKAGDVALTPISEIAGQIWQTDDRPTYRIAVPRSFAESLWHWLTESVAEFGCEVAG